MSKFKVGDIVLIVFPKNSSNGQKSTPSALHQRAIRRKHDV